MPDPISSPSGFTSCDDERFLRWCAEYPITMITSVGPPVRTGVAAFVELHGRLPDGTLRSEVIPHYWIGWGANASIVPSNCGLLQVGERDVLAIQRKDERLGNPPTHEVRECPCCGRLRYAPIDSPSDVGEPA